MMQSFFNGLSGMSSFSKGLDNVSNNIANMNTPGYKGKDVFLRNVEGGDGTGYGLALAGTEVRQGAGEIRSTGNATDLAVAGTGYFVLRSDSGEVFYTRAGQFKIDEGGDLIDTVSENHVLALSESGVLENFNIADNRVLPPEPTTSVELRGNLSASAEVDVSEEVSVFSETGEDYKIKFRFENTAAVTPNSWQVEVLSESDAVLAEFEIRFAADGSILDGYNSFDADISLGDQNTSINFNFGEGGSYSGATQFVGASTTIGADVKDGHAPLGLAEYKFDEDGKIIFKYSNGDEIEGQRIALAGFYDSSSLKVDSGSLYSADSSIDVNFGYASDDYFGKIQAESIELSNVDLTQEFADILIIQRGYQASSNVMSIANEMLEQLYNSTR